MAESYYHFSLARMHSQDKQLSQALAEFAKAIELNPDSAELRVHHALALLENNEIRRFVAECEKAVELDPSDPEPHLLLGRYYFSYRDSRQAQSLLDKAVLEFERVIELEPNHFQGLNHLARLYIFKERWDKAADVLARLAAQNPAYADAHYLRALALVRLEKTDAAKQVLEKAREYRAVDIEGLKLLAGLYLQYQEKQKAIQVLREAAEMDARVQDPEVRLELAKALNEGRRYAEARDVLDRVPAGGQFDAAVNFELARALAGMGRRGQAVEKYQNLLNSQKDENLKTVLRSRLAVLYEELHQYDKALELLREVAKAEPDRLESQLPLAFGLKEAGKNEEALALVEELAAKFPDHPHVVLVKGQILGAMGQADKGVELLTSSPAGTEDPETFLLAASQLYVETKKYEDAEKVVKKGLETLPDSESMHFQLGAIYERQEKYSNAEESFKKVLEKNPEHPGVLNYFGYMLAERGQRLEEALAYVKKAVELDPHNGAYLDSLGWVYFQLKQYVPAELYLKQAAEIIDDDPTIMEHLGDLYRKLERYGEAGEYYEKSLAQSKENEEKKRIESKLSSVKKFLSQRTR